MDFHYHLLKITISLISNRSLSLSFCMDVTYAYGKYQLLISQLCCQLSELNELKLNKQKK